MRLTDLVVSNYRGLREVSIPLSHFGCLIGENNSGKSSILQTVSLFFSGSKLSAANFFDESKPIQISITFEDISDADLDKLVLEHREKVRAIVDDGRLTLVRAYAVDGKSTLLYNRLMPTDARFANDSIAALLKSGRAGQAFVSKVSGVFPEIQGSITVTMNQGDMRDAIQQLADSLPDDQKTAMDIPLPTGIDKSIMPMLPDPVYIPAVKDLADDIKTTETAPFGKILGILLRAIETKLPGATELFEKLNSQLNRVIQTDGSEVDERLPEVQLIESTLEQFVQESFANVKVRISIPPPELKTIFSSAQIYANDGVDGTIETKGDGLRRAIVFSILRSYVSLRSQLTDAGEEAGGPAVSTPYFLLFEEPELFLHPQAQRVLFDALRVFSSDHHVLVSTHSPLFFGPDATTTFVKLSKVSDPDIAAKPYTLALPIELSDMTAKDQFQIICFENNNAAFFGDTVVLVEGDSDYLLFPHMAKTINPNWDVTRLPIEFARITGKGNISRYRDFFKRFNVRVPVIADLDLLLNGFHHVSPSDEIKDMRDQLLAKVDELIPEDSGNGATTGEARTAHASGELQSLYRAVKGKQVELRAGECTIEEVEKAMDDFFAWTRKSDRLDILMNCDDTELLKLKWQILETLRQDDVFILERGNIEHYYPEDVTGQDKPSKAQDFCCKVITRDAVMGCCGEQEFTRDGEEIKEKEFQLIFGAIFMDQVE